MATFDDGGGLARVEWRRAMKWLEEEQAALVALRAFAEKWKDTLAGMSWSLHKWGAPSHGPEVEVGSMSHYYRGERVGAEGIAALFGADGWTRKKKDYSDPEYLQYDWLKPLDGITLIIKTAESTRIVPVDPGRHGTKVRLGGKAVAA